MAVVTTTSAEPSAPAGVTAMIWVLPRTWTSVAGTPPTVTVAPAREVRAGDRDRRATRHRPVIRVQTVAGCSAPQTGAANV